MKNLTRLLGAIIAVCMLASIATVAFAATENDAVKYFTDHNYLRGDENGELHLDASVTRAEFAALVNRLCGYTETADISNYTDVSENAWYHDDIAAAVNAGYYQGFNGTMFPTSQLTGAQVSIVMERIFGTAVSSIVGSETVTRQQCVELLYNAVTSAETIYGTATLTFAEFYSGDVSSTDSYDAVSSATNTKSATFSNCASDFVDADTNADGYHITGVKNVTVAVKASDLDAYRAINPTFAITGTTEPSQYKTVTVSGSTASYSATKFNVADTVTNASAQLQTASVWGDYQINVYDPEGTTYLRNTRSDEGFAINSKIQGIILETASGLKVGMEYLQSIWVQPYEVSFNVLSDNTHNAHIAQFDNLEELSKLVGETVTKITYIMPDSTYVYTFDGIYIKPVYTGSITAVFGDGIKDVTLSTSELSAFTNGTLTVTYTVGSGRQATAYTLCSTALVNGTATYAVDTSVIADVEEGGTYSVKISSESYADYTVSIPMTAEQKAELQSLVTTAESGNMTSILEAHVAEAKELLSNEKATSAAAADLISELKTLIAEAQK